MAIPQAGNRARILIIGGGFAGAYCAQALARRGLKNIEITLLNRNNYFVFYPLLVEAGTGGLATRHVIVSLRSFLHGCRFQMGAAIKVDEALGQVYCRIAHSDDVRRIDYDYLVIALGSVTLMPPIDGLREHGFELKSLADAGALRDHAIEMLERAENTADVAQRRALLRFVIVGGSFTGVELAGEFLDFLRAATRVYRNLGKNDVSVVLVEREDRLLPALDEDLAKYAANEMRSCGADIRLADSVKRITTDSVDLASGKTLQTNTTVWCAGVAPNPILDGWPFEKDGRGYLLTHRDGLAKNKQNIYAIGDCAVNDGPDGSPYPATAQHAVEQGKQLAANLHRRIAGQSTQPIDIKSKGSIAAIGCRTGVARVFGLKISGFWAWWLFRTVYLMKMPGMARKFRVAMDWTMDLIFPRDFVQLGLARSRYESVKLQDQASPKQVRGESGEPAKDQSNDGRTSDDPSQIGS